jgi:hypothetical protein
MLKIKRVRKGSYRAFVNGRQVHIWKSHAHKGWLAQFADGPEGDFVATGRLLADVRASLSTIPAINAADHTLTAKDVSLAGDSDVDDTKRQYREIRERANEVHGLARREFDLACAANVEDKSDPQAWLDAAIALEFTCPACEGTGVYDHPGAPNASGGACYKCNGKGVQDAKDRRRNAVYRAKRDGTDWQLSA